MVAYGGQSLCCRIRSPSRLVWGPKLPAMICLTTTLVCSLLSLLTPSIECQEAASAPINVTTQLATSRPTIRPGEWFTLALVVEAADGKALLMGPPDDGTIPPKGVTPTTTKLLWSTEGTEDYRLLPDLMAVQWPRPIKSDDQERAFIELPCRIYIPVKAAPKANLGAASLSFELEGFLFTNTDKTTEGGTPFTQAESVTVEIVHPTDPEATDVTSVDPRLFAGWRGETPDWTVMDTRVPRPPRKAPLLTWLVVTLPVAAVGLALFWAFATKRL